MANHSPIKDTGAFFTIVPETRAVTVPQTHKVIGVVGDHLAEQLTFEIPQLIDGHDIGGCARRYVSWANVDGEPGNDQLKELTERPEGAKEGMLYFTWTIRDRLAADKGLVQFSVHFEDIDAQGVTLYHWGTTNCKNCEILDSVNHAIGAYKAIWVAGDTLVIEDYTPVEDGILALETPGIVPEGTLEINEAGVHDVGPYAQVRVIIEELSPISKGEVVNNASKTVYVDYVADDPISVNTGVKDMKKVEIAPGATLRIEASRRFSRVSVYSLYTADLYGASTELPTGEFLAFGALAGCSDVDTDRSWSIAIVASVDGHEFSIEIVDR